MLLAREAAQERRYHRADQGASVNFTEGGEVLQQIAKLLDLSRAALGKARKVVAAAGEDKEEYGDLIDRRGDSGSDTLPLLKNHGALRRTVMPVRHSVA